LPSGEHGPGSGAVEPMTKNGPRNGPRNGPNKGPKEGPRRDQAVRKGLDGGEWERMGEEKAPVPGGARME
ncbi:hypothetical protein V502_10001, partial [Pseudogymnoascus sp. VKM F-4520 (FW-2644)]